jgi:hypothetical protein
MALVSHLTEVGQVFANPAFSGCDEYVAYRFCQDSVNFSSCEPWYSTAHGWTMANHFYLSSNFGLVDLSRVKCFYLQINKILYHDTHTQVKARGRYRCATRKYCMKLETQVIVLGSCYESSIL